ncbi:hypothetical protein WJR50_21420 [Catalinimonas sp. 4WD22]|uniref:hypothetical protein n=1 Tax=Catalinimonas locisalis TaxID=3133978 RepID=UPI003100F3D8
MLGIPLFVFATAFASLSIIIGLIWDISWHTSIGRDGLLSPPHLGMYLGAVVSGLFSGYQVLKTSFWGSKAENQRSVRFWGIFSGSLGALFCIWGCFAMLTSAPFDDWWHNTYGLDVTILSPPHTVLLLGMMMVQFGAMISVLAMQNQPAPAALSASQENRRNRLLRTIYVVTSGFFLVMLYTMASEFQGRHDMHGGTFYIVGGLLYPFFLSAIARSSKLKWAATATAGVYMLVLLLLAWILPFFPAEPLLGPILNDITHYQAFDFPLLLIIPAIAIDMIMQRKEASNKWLLALVIGPVFVLLLLAVQWPFGDFLMSPYARNWFFAQESWYFGSNPDWEYRYAYAPWMVSSGWPLIKSLLIAIGISILTTRLGLHWGGWMKKVMR